MRTFNYYRSQEAVKWEILLSEQPSYLPKPKTQRLRESLDKAWDFEGRKPTGIEISPNFGGWLCAENPSMSIEMFCGIGITTNPKLSIPFRFVWGDRMDLLTPGICR